MDKAFKAFLESKEDNGLKYAYIDIEVLAKRKPVALPRPAISITIRGSDRRVWCLTKPSRPPKSLPELNQRVMDLSMKNVKSLQVTAFDTESELLDKTLEICHRYGRIIEFSESTDTVAELKKRKEFLDDMKVI